MVGAPNFDPAATGHAGPAPTALLIAVTCPVITQVYMYVSIIHAACYFIFSQSKTSSAKAKPAVPLGKEISVCMVA